MVDRNGRTFTLVRQKARPGDGVGSAHASRETLVVSAREPQDLKLAERTLRAVDRFIIQSRQERSADRIGKLIDIMLDGEPISPTQEALEQDNAALRARYLQTVPTFSASDLHRMAGSRSSNRSALAGGWKEKRRVFAVPHNGQDRFPAFQFIDGQPLKSIKEILSALPTDLSAWQIAFWFASGNGWLGGAAPQERLDDPAAVVVAAQRMNETIVG